MELGAVIRQFEGIGLEEINQLSLMKRVDTKFMISAKQLPELLTLLPPEYKILEIGGERLLSYRTSYYDTSDFTFFYEHLRGRKKRLKIRIREYLDTNVNFIEIKKKDNKGVTNKQRQLTDSIGHLLDDNQVEYLTDALQQELKLELKIENKFKRVTLVNFETQQRVTIDTHLSFEGNSQSLDFPQLCIIEIKESRVNRNSPIFKQLKALRQYPMRISKYCLGVSKLYTGVKANAMKVKLRFIHKLAS